MEIKQAITDIKKAEKRKFDQSIDLIINLKGIDIKKDNIATVINIPHQVKEKKVCGFLTKKSSLVKSILLEEFPKYKDKAELKKLVKGFDFFIATAKLMPAIATTFGKALGPLGKMPSPQLGVLMKEDDAAIKEVLSRVNTAVKIRVKEPSVKISIGKESMDDKILLENIMAVYEGLIAVLPIKKDNVKSILIKTTMGKPVNVEVK